MDAKPETRLWRHERLAVNPAIARRAGLAIIALMNDEECGRSVVPAHGVNMRTIDIEWYVSPSAREYLMCDEDKLRYRRYPELRDFMKHVFPHDDNSIHAPYRGLAHLYLPGGVLGDHYDRYPGTVELYNVFGTGHMVIEGEEVEMNVGDRLKIYNGTAARPEHRLENRQPFPRVSIGLQL